jgi:hypothetical protein
MGEYGTLLSPEPVSGWTVGGMFLRAKSGEYERLAKWHAERAPLNDEHVVACEAMAAVGIDC